MKACFSATDFFCKVSACVAESRPACINARASPGIGAPGATFGRTAAIEAFVRLEEGNLTIMLSGIIFVKPAHRFYSALLRPPTGLRGFTRAISQPGVAI